MHDKLLMTNFWRIQNMCEFFTEYSYLSENIFFEKPEAKNVIFMWMHINMAKYDS